MAGSFKNFSELCAEVFIETGTFLGSTTHAAFDSNKFELIRTIELDRELYLRTIKTFRDECAVHVYFGRSVDVLPCIIDSSVSTVFWLDAHKTMDMRKGKVVGAFDRTAECPLLDELKIITAVNWHAPVTVMIDDARMFHETFWNAQSKQLWNRTAWPLIDEVIGILSASGYRTKQVGDIVIGRKSDHGLR